MLRAIRPFVEALEDRQCLSATMLVLSQQGGTLRISGNDEWNFVQVTQDDTNDTLKVVYGQLPHNATSAALVVNTQVVKSSSISRISVDLGNGNDNFEYTLAPGTDLVYSKDLIVYTGEGDDSVTINTSSPAMASATSLIEMPQINGTAGLMTADGEFVTIAALQNSSITSTHSPVIRSSFNVTVYTQGGDDQACISLGSVRDGLKINVSVDLGDGQDQFWLCNYGTINKRATVTINVDGSYGKDSINLGNYADVIGTLSLNAKGGTEDDSFFIDLQGQHNGKTTVGIDTGAGNDVVTINNQTSPFSTGSLLISPVR